jgi:transaldolase
MRRQSDKHGALRDDELKQELAGALRGNRPSRAESWRDPEPFTEDDPLAQLTSAGVEVWLDDLSRRRLTTGGLARLARARHVAGVTSNPTIFAKALSTEDEYDGQLGDLAHRGATVGAAVREITTEDVRTACDVLSDVGGKVSIEVDPTLAHDTDGTVAQALDLWRTVDRPNLFVKIPATDEGLPAIARTLSEGVSVNVTLMFAVRRYRQVMDAYFAGLERAAAHGHDISRIASVASFFVSRVDAEVDERLAKIGTDEAMALRGTAAIANARLAYSAYQQMFASARWQALAESGAVEQRPLWASTGVKNPDYPDTMYVTELVAPNVVNTMPEATLEAFADHGEVRGDTVTGTAAEAGVTLQRLSDAGIDMNDVHAVLEREGVAKFAASWQELRDTVERRLEAVKEGRNR